MKKQNSGVLWLLVVGATAVWWWLGMPGLPQRQATIAPAPQVQQPQSVEVVVIVPTSAPLQQGQEFQSATSADSSLNDGSQDHTAATAGSAGVDSGVTVMGGENAITVNNYAGTSAEASDTSGAAQAQAAVENTAGQSAALPASSAPGPNVSVRFWAQDVSAVSASGISVWVFDWKGSGALVSAQGDTEGRVQMTGAAGAYISACWINQVGTVYTWGSILSNERLQGDIQLTLRTDYDQCPDPTWVP